MARPSPQTDRIISLVDLLASRVDGGLTQSEIARRLGVSPATCQPMLVALSQAGWLVRHPTRKAYRLGPALAAVGHAAVAGFTALEVCHPTMVDLQQELGLTCLALAPGEQHATLVDMVRAPRVTDPAMRIGDQTPFQPPLGIAFMAWADDQAVEAWLQRGRVGPEARAHYQQVLAATRRRRFSVELVTPPEARVRDALSHVDDDSDSASARRLRTLLEELATELAGEEEFLPVSLAASRSYRVSSVASAVFDDAGDVSLLLALRGFAEPVPGRKVEAIGRRLVEATGSITSAIGGAERR